ncbi:MAG: hypothetical protein H6731_00080 [Myxococcales bacterium]|nr:MAG: hypothetical protein H6731_00080 [Myxococcales bacterium]
MKNIKLFLLIFYAGPILSYSSMMPHLKNEEEKFISYAGRKRNFREISAKFHLAEVVLNNHN